MIGSMVALALFGGLFQRTPADAPVQRFQVRGWTAEVKTDGFSGAVSCRLRSGRATVTRGGARFDLGRWTNTSAAEYRIDGAAVKSGREAMMNVALLGVRTISANASNPSNGIVHIPAAELSAASAVAIRPAPGARVRTFAVAGLQEALDAEKQRGCDLARAY
jgi:hypothetical protein